MKLKYWEQLRNAVVHEDNLVNNRLTWLITVEGFLLGGFAAFCASILSNADKLAVLRCTVGDSFLIAFALGALGIFFVGSLLCLVTCTLVGAAIERVAGIKAAWCRRYREERAWCRRYPEEREMLNIGVDGEDPLADTDFPPIFGRLPLGIWEYFNIERQHAKILLLSIPCVLWVINFSVGVLILWEAEVVLGRFAPVAWIVF